jgi:hypothetical protein
MTASRAASKQVMTDSTKNCAINDDLSAPVTFRTPISFALTEALAVARLT